MNQDHRKRKLTPLNVTIAYAVIGVVWGALSCLFPAVFARQSGVYQGVETVNHGFFILATGGLLFLLLRRS
jgi:hypothetical protein